MKKTLLAEAMRPKKIEEIIGQEHLIGKGKILYNLIKNDYLFSMILYGPPGTGKTTLAMTIAESLNKKVRFLNAVINNKKDFDIVIEEAKMYGEIILIMDEIHRLNKDKQDLLLPSLESGLVTLIGMTTVNPYHKINPAIRSRCQIFKLDLLIEADIIKGLKRVVRKKVLPNLSIDSKSYKLIASLANGDIRYALNLLELAYYGSSDKKITVKYLETINSKASLAIFKDDDEYYNLLSGLQKSIRGSDVDAALHYLAALIQGDDLDSICRRLTVIGYEDIGLANPQLCGRINAAITSAEYVGFPEARIPLSVIVCELALSPKSNTAYRGLDMASADLNKGNIGDIPSYIKSPFKGYKYPHDYPNNFVAQQYLPSNIKNMQYFNPKTGNKYESNLADIYDKLKAISKK